MHQLISIGSQDLSTYVCKSHRHTCWEITYYYEGSGFNTTNGTRYPFSEGTVICQPPLLPHGDDSKEGYKNIYFLVGDSGFSGSEPLVFRDSANREFLQVLRLLYAEFHENGNSPVTAALLQVLSEYIRRLLSPSRSNYYVELFEEKLILNFSNPHLSLEEQMEQIPFSKNHFRRIFEQETGCPPKEYLTRLRISHAKELLRSTTLRINEICFLCGFSDPFYFSRIFRKYTGESPKDWRKTF